MIQTLSDRLVAWQRVHGRHDLPWQVSDPYRVWLSEVMLQQTQVCTVIPYFLRFVGRFPDVATLAAAEADEVLALWSGLGYYSRARNLHQAAQMIVRDYGGCFPQSQAGLMVLPGIGRSTAAAIAAFSFGERTAILDGNVKRVLARWAGVEGWPGEKRIENRLWQLAESLLPEKDVASYTQGLMDLGSLVCTRSRPGCDACPLAQDCVAKAGNLQSSLPSPRPRKNMPERYTVMLLVRSEGRILLERRPPAGIWGGLWSLPEAPDTLTAAGVCRERHGLEVAFDDPDDELVHTFTHFRLTICPLPGRVRGGMALQEGQSGWFSRDEALGLGLPAPVRRLLDKS